jgi:hypothetical protein
MTTITIPQPTKDKEDLIAIPHQAYEEFLEWQKKEKSKKEYTPTQAEKEALQNARKNLREGKCLTIDEAYKQLGIDN